MRMTQASQPQATQGGRKVLIVDDSKAITALLEANIRAIEGLEPVVASDYAGAQALLSLHATELFVAVLDLNLPDAPDGEVVELVRPYGIPVIVLTGRMDETNRKALFQRNIADYIGKSNLGGVGTAVRLVERIWHNRESQILVVDDSAAQRALLGQLLRNHGYQVLQACDGKEGLALLADHPQVRLVLTDHEMPRMDGLEMTHRMRRLRGADELAIIAISGAERDGLLARYLKAGANDFLTKPFEVEEFYCRIDQNLDMLQYIRKAWDAANRDYLTGLYNRRYFFDRARALHTRAKAGEIRLMVAIIDADHFKSINDSFGHDMGDQALKAMASVLMSGASDDSFPARFGGEEFVCIGTIDQDDDPGECLESLRAAVEAIELRAEDGTRVPLTVSIGATCHLGDSIDEMLSVADEAVYLAKAQGRNRVYMLDGPDQGYAAGTAVRRRVR